MHDLSLALLQELNIAVLVRHGAMDYEYFGTPPKFYQELFPAEADGHACIRPWLHSPMIEFFLEDVEQFFTTSDSGSITSGVWQEETQTGDLLPLIATANKINNQEVLIIRNLINDFPNHFKILQKARENLLHQKKLHKSLDFYKKKSSYDNMTGLYNRETFLKILQSETMQKAYSNSSMALLMVDIDNFKDINDTYGHLEGDKVLQGLGKLFMEFLRKDDLACRYGGEEFLIFAPNTNIQQAKALAEKIRMQISQHGFISLPPITVSIGASIYQPGENVESCISRADAAMYRAKRSGKNTSCLK